MEYKLQGGISDMNYDSEKVGVVVFRPFSTPGGNYVYDRETNSILSLSRQEYESFARLYNNEQNERDLDVLEAFRAKGYFKNSALEEIRHPQDTVISFHLENRIEKITLQVTQNCNLNCSYCTYSENKQYKNRTHANRVMSLETMRKSVDFFMQHSTNMPKVDIGFYGGEPLLGFENIKKLVAYIEQKYPYKKRSYSMTTNGTISSDEIINFLSEKDFNVVISLDGPKELHDMNRVFDDGQGSFDKIMENLLYVKNQYPAFFEKISFNTVVAPGSDFRCVDDFFNASDIIEDNVLNMSTVSDLYSESQVSYDELYTVNYGIQRTKMLLAALGYIDKDKTSKLFRTNMAILSRMYETLGTISGLSKIAHPGGPCLPGGKRSMIDVHGNIFPCERVSEESEVMRIGHIDTGFDIDKVKSILNIGSLTSDECKHCWNFIHCNMCAAVADNLSNLDKELKLKQCSRAMNDTLSQFATICLLRENGYVFEEGKYGL